VVRFLLEVGALRQVGDGPALAKRLDEIFVLDIIQDVIMARIDRLAEVPKRTLQLALVIGRQFTRRLLDRLAEIRSRTEEGLQELKSVELIYEKSLVRELAFMFRQALTIAQAIGNPTRLWKTHLALDQLQAEAKRRQQARNRFRLPGWSSIRSRKGCRTPF
jgi:hypothetical protein